MKRKSMFPEGGLRKGHKGGAVKALQMFLRAAKMAVAGLEIDGDFGKLTESSLRAFQDAHGLVETGVLDQVTMTKIAEVYKVNLAAMNAGFFQEPLSFMEPSVSFVAP